MKRIISLIIVLCLILGSFSFAFAAEWSATDSNNLSNAASRLSSILTTVNNIYSALNYGGHTISYWVNAIDSWMQPIYGRLTDLIQQGVTQDIAGLLASTETIGDTTVRTPYLFYNGKSVANWMSDLASGFPRTTNVYGLPNASSSITSFTSNNLAALISDTFAKTFQSQHARNNVSRLDSITLVSSYDGVDYSRDYKSSDDLLAIGLYEISKSQARITAGYNDKQTAVDWLTLNDDTGINPSSETKGLYYWLSKIQNPVARLSYVLASDERIEAQQAAAANEEAVVNNFIDSNGDAAASTDNFGEIASGSANVKQNFSTGYSVSNMWGAFGSEHYGWFSQECADALDTSYASSLSTNRLLKNDKHDESDYDTPLLDEYYKQILSLGGGSND